MQDETQVSNPIFIIGVNGDERASTLYKWVSILMQKQPVQRSCVTKNELLSYLTQNKPEAVVFFGHGTLEGDWVLGNGDTIEKSDIINSLNSHACSVYSFSCYSDKWTGNNGNLRIIGFSSNFAPLSKGSTGWNYLLMATKQKKLLLPRLEQEQNEILAKASQFSEQAVEEALFTMTENYLVNTVKSWNLTLVQPRPDPRQCVRIVARISDIPKFPKSRCGQYFPRGFLLFTDFRRKVRELKNIVANIDADVSFVIHGSSITGYRHAYKHDRSPFFDDNSDYDVAVCSPFIFEVCQLCHKTNFNTEPIKSHNCRHFGQFGTTWDRDLKNLKWENRDVNFMIYNSQDSAKHHAGLSLSLTFVGEDLYTTLTGDFLFGQLPEFEVEEEVEVEE